MAKKIAGIFKCRNCGAVLTDKVQYMTPSTEWMLKEMFKDNEEYLVAGGSSVMGDLGMIHRCDPEKLCVCDFIGWKIGEEVQEDV